MLKVKIQKSQKRRKDFSFFKKIKKSKYYSKKDFSIARKAIMEMKQAKWPTALKTAKKADAVLFGAVGAPQWDGLSWEDRPENALLTLRKELNLFANL